MKTYDEAISDMTASALADYRNFNWRSGGEASDKDMDFVVTHGRSYTKISSVRLGYNDHKMETVWGFVVRTEKHPKFKYGDILKAASYKAPATNHARGNIFGVYEVNWTGPQYMGENVKAMNDVNEKMPDMVSVI